MGWQVQIRVTQTQLMIIIVCKLSGILKSFNHLKIKKLLTGNFQAIWSESHNCAMHLSVWILSNLVAMSITPSKFGVLHQKKWYKGFYAKYVVVPYPICMWRWYWMVLKLFVGKFFSNSLIKFSNFKSRLWTRDTCHVGSEGTRWKIFCSS